MRVLFHIGLAKAGSTYLQRWFASHPDIVQMQDLFPIVKKGQWLLENSPKLAVLSDERFGCYLRHSAGWDKRFDESFDPRDYQRRTRDFLYQLNPDAHILLITRAPSAGLLKSIYSQYVKTGGSESFATFYRQKAVLVAAAFDYESLYELYVERFTVDRTLVLPLEFMRRDLEGFLGVIEQRFGLSRFRLPKQRINVSVSDREMLLYSRVNRAVSAQLGRLLDKRGYRVFMLYIKLLSSGLLRPLAHAYGILHPNALKNQFVGIDNILEQVRPKGQKVLSLSHFDSCRQDYLGSR